MGDFLRGYVIEKLCVFGSYDDSELYSRNRILIDALGNCSDKVVEIRPRQGRPAASNHQRVASSSGLLRTALELAGNLISLARQRKKLRGADCVFVPYPAYIDLLLLRMLIRSGNRPKIIVDGFLCLHDTLVRDRKMVAPGGLAARCVGWLENSTLQYPDLVFIDTEQQKTLLCKQYALDEKGIAVIPVGIDESRWTALPALPPSDRFRVIFWGTFIPLHGVDTIVMAASYLGQSHPHIDIRIIGDGQTAPQCARLIEEMGVSNISWQRRLLPAGDLRAQLEQAHCVLGVFGTSDKAGNVVPYKAYQAMASNKILISRRGPAMSALLDEACPDAVILVPPGDPEALAAAMSDLSDRYSETYLQLDSRAVYERQLSNRKVFGSVAAALERL